MHRKRSSSSAVAVLAIPLLLSLPHTLVAAFRIYDYIPSAFGGVGSRSGGSLVRRDDLSQLGFYNPLDYGGYMLTVSLPPLQPSPAGSFLCPFPDAALMTEGADHLCSLFVVPSVGFRVLRGQYIPTEYTIGLGEPVNAILSAKSDPQILIDQEADGGLRNYFLCVFSSLDLSRCFSHPLVFRL